MVLRTAAENFEVATCSLIMSHKISGSYAPLAKATCTLVASYSRNMFTSLTPFPDLVSSTHDPTAEVLMIAFLYYSRASPDVSSRLVTNRVPIGRQALSMDIISMSLSLPALTAEHSKSSISVRLLWFEGGIILPL